MAGTVALVVAAGRGDRFGADLPKQYAPLAGRPLLRHSLSALAAHPGIGAVRAVIGSDDRDHYDRAAEGLTLLDPVPGGASRQDSVREGLESLEILTPERVLIHDGARPLLPGGVIDRVLAALDEAPGAVAALPVTDTLKRGEEGRIAGTVAREGLWRAQTPQGFHYPAILDAHRKAAAGFELTDDAAVAEAAGLAVRLVEGAAENIKVTTPDDLAQAETLLAGGTALLAETRTGSGFDVHRFGPGDHVNLCGLRIPHERTLLGHSDADVGLHAVTDAVLGALSAGDIGQHFPPSDPQWRGADSGQFLIFARDLVSARKGRIINVDITLICETPKLAPHRDAMIERVAELLGIETERVSVKATTTEGLGFTGRSEGIAAQATATLSLPRRG
jgi:2-C-methyl-D-erythritol 4-phosphate cytidylyltransferase/2-C-methyl-D-erythritol 2,4-cyclodiphosphate synthase